VDAGRVCGLDDIEVGRGLGDDGRGEYIRRVMSGVKVDGVDNGRRFGG